MSRHRVKPSEGDIVTWFSRFWKYRPENTSPEIRPKRNRFELIGAPPKGDEAALPPPPVEPVPEPAPAPEPAPSPRPPPRQLRIKDGQLFEIGEDGRMYLAGDDGRQEEGVPSNWKKMRDREINFGIDPGKEWRDGG